MPAHRQSVWGSQRLKVMVPLLQLERPSEQNSPTPQVKHHYDLTALDIDEMERSTNRYCPDYHIERVIAALP